MIRTAVFSILIFAVGINLRAQNIIPTRDSSERILATGQLNDSKALPLYEELSLKYIETNHELAIRYCMEGIAVAERLKQWRTTGELYKNMGYVYYSRNQYDSAQICFDKVLEAAERSSRKEDRDYLEIKAYLHKGLVSNANGRIHEEIDNYFKALKIAERIGDKDNMQKLYGNIGAAYLTLENDRLAMTYFMKGEKVCLELKDSLSLYYHLTGLSNVNCRLKNYEKALEQAEAAHRIVQSRQTLISDEFFVFQLLARIHEEMNNYEKARNYAHNAMQLAESINSSLYLCWALENIASIELHSGRYAESEKAALRAMEVDSSDVFTNVKLFEYLTKANIMLGHKEKADMYLTRFTALMNESSGKTFQASLSEMEVKYETEKKEMRISALEDEKRLVIWLSITGGGALLLALIATILLRRWTIQKKRLAEQQVIRLQQEKQLVATQAVLDGEVQERTRLARDLHDGLGSILSAAKYNFADMRKTSAQEIIDPERFDKAMKLIDDSMREMRRVAHHLMPESLNKFGLKRSVADFCNSIPHAQFAWYGDETRLDSKLEVMVYRIMHELVNNALKHSGASHILVEIVRYDDKIALTVQDDGCGFNPSAESEGMGLANIRTRVAAYNGNLLVDSKEGVGTEVNVELKVES